MLKTPLGFDLTLPVNVAAVRAAITSDLVKVPDGRMGADRRHGAEGHHAEPDDGSIPTMLRCGGGFQRFMQSVSYPSHTSGRPGSARSLSLQMSAAAIDRARSNRADDAGSNRPRARRPVTIGLRPIIPVARRC